MARRRPPASSILRRLRRRLRRKQVTCLCYRYPFPHRLGGGKCEGAAWAESYLENERSECDGCTCYGGNQCDVAEGREAISYCAGFRDHLKNKSLRRHPVFLDMVEEESYATYQRASQAEPY